MEEQIINPSVEVNDELNGINNPLATTEEVSSAEELSIPDNWEQPLKEFIGSISDPVGKKAIFDKIKSFDDGYMKKMSDLANKRKEFDSERNGFETDRGYLNSYRGFEKTIDQSDLAAISSKFGNIPNYMTYLYNMDRMASNNPAEFIINYCKSAGVDTVDKLSEMLDSPQAQKLGTEQDWKAREQAIMQQMEARFNTERETTRLTAEIQSFITEKDAAGNPAHPHFDAVRQQMIELSNKMPDANISELYDIAVWRNPELRATLQNPGASQDIAKARAAIGVKNAPKVAPIEKKENWQEVLARQIYNN
jgi:hypothetical protein